MLKRLKKFLKNCRNTHAPSIGKLLLVKFEIFLKWQEKVS